MHFQVVTTDGEALGPMELARPDCPTGSVIYTGSDKPDLRVVDNIPTENLEQFSILVVEPIE